MVQAKKKNMYNTSHNHNIIILFYVVNTISDSFFTVLMHSVSDPFMLIACVFQPKAFNQQRLPPIYYHTLIANVAKSWLLNFWAAPLSMPLHFPFLK